MWRVRWRFTIVHQCVQRRRNHWARKSLPVGAQRTCDAFIRKNVVVNIFRNCTTLIHDDTPTTLCKSHLFLFFNYIVVISPLSTKHPDIVITRMYHGVRVYFYCRGVNELMKHLLFNIATVCVNIWEVLLWIDECWKFV